MASLRGANRGVPPRGSPAIGAGCARYPAHGGHVALAMRDKRPWPGYVGRARDRFVERCADSPAGVRGSGRLRRHAKARVSSAGLAATLCAVGRGDSFREAAVAGTAMRRLVLVGDLDRATAPALDAQIALAERERPRVLVVDLGGVSFIDLAGMRVLASAARRARRARRRFVVRNPQRFARRALALSGLEDDLEVDVDG